MALQQTDSKASEYIFLTNTHKTDVPKIIEHPDGTKTLKWDREIQSSWFKEFVGPFLDIQIRNNAYAKDGCLLTFMVAIWVKKVA